MVERTEIWNYAGRSGLVLGGISIAYLLCGWAAGLINPEAKAATVIAGAAYSLLWFVKVGACIYLMQYFIIAFSSSHEGATPSDAFKFGCATAALSALLYSGFYFAYVLFIEPDTFEKAYEMMKESALLNGASSEMIEQMMPRLPGTSFLVNFIYCWTFGTVLSSLFCRKIHNHSDTNK